MTDFKDKVRLADVICTQETSKAILVLVDGEEHWIPNSQVDDESEVYRYGDEGDLVVSEWFASKEGLS